LNLGDIAGGAPTEIVSATDLPAASNPLGNWDACDVKGIIAPQIQFELRLPTSGWQGDYLQVGCGGVNVDNAPASYNCSR
jgi:feruloyl esterase